MAEYILKSDAVQCAAGLAKDFSDEGFHAEASGAYAVWEWLQDIPAADVRPVVRGKWSRIDYEPHGHDYKCSACGWKNDMPTHFCPNCGADMREESNG